jgi:dihydrofolate reductase
MIVYVYKKHKITNNRLEQPEIIEQFPMRKLVFFMLTSLDGYYEGPGHAIDWHNVDAEFNKFAIAQLDAVDTLLFGRVTYEMMAAFWPTDAAMKNDPVTAAAMNRLPKVVFSRTLASATWQNTRLVKDHLAEEVIKLKEQAGKDLIILGSSDLSVSLVQDGLIDEFRIMVNPVALGNGKTLFNGLPGWLKLELIKTRTFKSGNVLLNYRPKGKPS